MSQVPIIPKVNLDDCWHYAGIISPEGYGKIYHQTKGHMAHRVSYENSVEQIPDGLVIDHLCRVRCCINPDHLEVVTIAENTRRGAMVKTHCPYDHPYSGVNLRFSPRGYRVCRECSRRTTRIYKRRIRAERKAAKAR